MQTFGSACGATMLFAAAYLSCAQAFAADVTRSDAIVAQPDEYLPLVDSETADPVQWRRVAVHHAIEAAHTITDPYRAGEVFANIARTQTVIADVPGAEASIRYALQFVPQIAQAEFRGWVQHEIVIAQLGVDDVIGARETADAIAAERPQGAALLLIAQRQLRGGNLDNAEITAGKIRDDASAGEVLREIVAAKAARGEFTQARALQRQIDDDFYSATALADIAVVEALADDLIAAKATIGKVSRAQRSMVMGQVALALLSTGRSVQAMQLSSDIDDPSTRALIASRLALDRKRSGEAAESRTRFLAALEVLEDSNANLRRKVSTQVSIARLQVLAGFADDARVTLHKALNGLSGTADRERDSILDVAAHTFLRFDDFASALQVAATIDDSVIRALLIRDVVTRQIAAGARPEEIARANWSKDELAHAAALFGMLGSELGRADIASARRSIDAAREQVRKIADVQLRPPAFAALAAASLTAREPRLGREIFNESLDAARAIERTDQRAMAFVRVANALNDRLLFLGRPANQPQECAGGNCAAE